MHAEANMIPGPKIWSQRFLGDNFEALDNGFMSVGQSFSVKGRFLVLLEVVQMAIGYIHFPSHHCLLDGIQSRQVRRFVDGWQQPFVEARQEAPKVHSSADLDEPLN